MDIVKIGVLGPSEIAFRRTVPAILKSKQFKYAGIAYASTYEWSDEGLADVAVIAKEREKAEKFQNVYGGNLYDSYEALFADDDIAAVYIPLPPSLHYKWAMKAMKSGKHVFIEKPLTTKLTDAKSIIEFAQSRNLAVHENFAFIFHKQITAFEKIIQSGEIGELRLIRAAFGFPYRGENDFRYHKELGGGALTDCGGYPIKLAAHFLGDTVHIVTSTLSAARGHDVDTYGTATLANAAGLTAQITFGMDNAYKCELELWGSLGTAFSGRAFTPPADLKVKIKIITQTEREIEIDMDDQFQNSAEHFYKCITGDDIRRANYMTMLKQSELMEGVRLQNNG